MPTSTKTNSTSFVSLFFGFHSIFFLFLFCFTADTRNRPPEFRDEFNNIPFYDVRKPISDHRRVLILPVSCNKDRQEFQDQAFETLSQFFRNYNFIVPSKLKIDQVMLKKGITQETYENNFRSLAQEFRAQFVIWLHIKRIDRTKKLNAAGTLVAGATVTGVGRYATGEYVLKVFDPKSGETKSYTALEREKDYMFGLFQSAHRLALRLQKRTLTALLDDFASRKLLRSKGYILTPLQKVYPDQKGFQ